MTVLGLNIALETHLAQFFKNKLMMNYPILCRVTFKMSNFH